MKVIIGLGNPGAEYAHTRHNIGFDVLDGYAQKNETSFSKKDKFRSFVAELTKVGEKILLVKPSTYYNDSGISARALMDFYKFTPEDVLVIHDELMLPFGSIRTRSRGSDAGNNGIKSLNTHIGENTARIRIGTHNDSRRKGEDRDYVLDRFSSAEKEILVDLEPTVHKLIDGFISGDFRHTTYVLDTEKLDDSSNEQG